MEWEIATTSHNSPEEIWMIDPEPILRELRMDYEVDYDSLVKGGATIENPLRMEFEKEETDYLSLVGGDENQKEDCRKMFAFESKKIAFENLLE